MDVDLIEIALEDSNKIDDRVGACDRAVEGLGPLQVRGNCRNLADPAQRLEEPCAARVALGDP
jgi:hypothetical protein